jgi:hypothetical protein
MSGKSRADRLCVELLLKRTSMVGDVPPGAMLVLSRRVVFLVVAWILDGSYPLTIGG